MTTRSRRRDDGGFDFNPTDRLGRAITRRTADRTTTTTTTGGARTRDRENLRATTGVIVVSSVFFSHRLLCAAFIVRRDRTAITSRRRCNQRGGITVRSFYHNDNLLAIVYTADGSRSRPPTERQSPGFE